MLALCLREARPAVLVMFGLRFGAGVVIAGHAELWRALAGLLAWTLVVFAVYLFNGVTDVVADRANHSTRPIASGLLPQDAAMRVAGAAAVLAIGLAVLTGTLFAILSAAFLLLGYAYSAPPLYLKRRTVTSVATAFCGAFLSYAAGFVVAGGDLAHVARTPLLPFAVIMAMWMGLVGAPAKDLPDAEGDRAAGRHSVATRYGQSGARLLVVAAAVVTVATAWVVSALLEPYLFKVAIVLSAGAVVVIVLALQRGGDRRSPYQGFMLTQYGGHLALLLPDLMA